MGELMDKFAALEKHIIKEIARLREGASSPEQWVRVVGKVEAYEQVLEWIKELDALEIVEQQQLYE